MSFQWRSFAALLHLTVQNYSDDREGVAEHPSNGNGVPEDQDRDDHGHSSLGIPKNLDIYRETWMSLESIESV